MNSVVHFELPADDLKRMTDFYNKVFGWKSNLMPELNYTTVQTTETNEQGMPKNPGSINGGVMKRDPMLPNIVITIGVDDTEAVLAEVVKHGGKVIQGREAVGDHGFAAYFEDTEGNIVGTWEVKK